MPDNRRESFLGWIAVCMSTLASCVWAGWGIIENFHEGWHFPSLLQNLGLMLVQYLSPALIFVALTVISIFHPRVGGALHALTGLALAFFLFGFDEPVPMGLIIVPMITLGALYWFGRPEPKQRALWAATGIPLLITIGLGLEPAVRVSQRFDDGDRGARLVDGNGVRLVWAPEGPGWPSKGVTWEEAERRCELLMEDGKALSDSPQHFWRLPTADEAARSMSRHGKNSGGTWDSATGKADYRIPPDKESPLWNPQAQVIYLWTASEIDSERAYIIVYDGKVWPRRKKFGPDYLSFRCVKSPG